MPLTAGSDAMAQTSCTPTPIILDTFQAGALESSDCRPDPATGITDVWTVSLQKDDELAFELFPGFGAPRLRWSVSDDVETHLPAQDVVYGAFLRARRTGILRIVLSLSEPASVGHYPYILRASLISVPPVAPPSFSVSVGLGHIVATWGHPSLPLWKHVSEFQFEIGSARGTSDIANLLLPVANDGRNSLSVPLQPGRYFLRVRARNAHGLGPPSDEVEARVMPPPCPTNRLTLGVNQHAVIEPHDCRLGAQPTEVGDAWTLFLNAGTLVSFEVRPGTMVDPVATLLDPSGSFVAATQSFDSAGRIRVITTTARATGEYRVQVTSGLSGHADYGTYVLRTGAIDAPAQPYLHSLSIEDGQLKAWWFSPLTPTPIVEYQLELGTAPGTRDVGVFSDLPSPLGYNVRHIPVHPGLYFVRVRGRNGQGWSEPSNELQLRITSLLANPPCCLSAAVRGRQVELHWMLSAGDPVAFVEVIAGRSAGARDLGSINVGNVTSVRFDDVPAGVYYVRVRAWNQQGPGPDSNEVTILVGPSLPAAPQNVIANVSDRRVRLTWSPPPFGDVTFYEVLAGSAPGLVDIGTSIVGANTSFEVPNVPPGRYYVRIRAWNGVGAGPASEEVVVSVN